jgi:electron transfer flavoprotein alpha subunit
VNDHIHSHSVVIVGELGQDSNVSQLTCELIGLGKGLVQTPDSKVCVVFLGKGSELSAQQVISFGVDKVFLAEVPASTDCNPEVLLGILKELCVHESPEIVLFGHTTLGADLAPRLAFSLGSGIVTDCIGISPGVPDGLLFAKPIYGGNASAFFSIDTDPKIATLRPRVGSIPVSDPLHKGEILRLNSGELSSRMQTVAKVEEDAGGVKLEEAKVIVSGGRGMGSAKGFEMLSHLVSILGGAVGSSRPPCELGWIAQNSQIGITGKLVSPDLYVAVGISGSIQHLTGMSKSGKIVAINKDPEAYIFRVSNYGVVGDWKEVIPAFIEKFEELEKQSKS